MHCAGEAGLLFEAGLDSERGMDGRMVRAAFAGRLVAAAVSPQWFYRAEMPFGRAVQRVGRQTGGRFLVVLWW